MATEPVWKTHLAADSVFDPQYHQSARAEVVSFLNDPPGVVLDVGCGGGATGKLIKEKFPGTRVIGIELNPHAADHARRVIDDVICESVDTVDLPQLLPDIRIDTVLLLDVLEHLYDPWRTLVRLRRWLTAGARVLASVPNIRNLSNLDELAAGRWEYAPNGVLDVTHLRFFTRSTLKRMFEETGFSVVHMEPLTQPLSIDRHILARAPGRIVARNITLRFRDFDDLQELYALQYVVDARATQPAATAA
ncbi:MAG: class I SAM-dependent methyltransferase [Betaproteobacteria bacterium]|nr:MAG: class I SAM-dependent methyltransferase [Betaproteobacteria bacterium]